MWNSGMRERLTLGWYKDWGEVRGRSPEYEKMQNNGMQWLLEKV